MENKTNSVHISSEKDNGGNFLRSMLMMTFSMLILGSVGVFRRYIPLSSSLLAFFRGAIGSLFLLIFLRVSGGKVIRSLPRRILALLIVSGAMIGVNWILMFEAYNYTTIPTATLCYYMEPTIVVLLSPVFFKKKTDSQKAGLCRCRFHWHGAGLRSSRRRPAAGRRPSGNPVQPGRRGTVFRRRHSEQDDPECQSL